MFSIDEFWIMKDWLEKKNRELALEIQLITEWIKEHRKIRPARVEALLPATDERKTYQSWRKVSCRLHQRRSDIKTEQEKMRTNLLAVNRRIEEMGTDFLDALDAPIYFDTALETDLTSVDDFV